MRVSPAKSVNLALRFLLELCALAAVAYWGSRVSTSTARNVAVAVAVVAPLVVAAVWGGFLAPNAAGRVDPSGRWALELLVLAAGVAALLAVDAPLLAVALAVVAVVNATLLHLWGLDEDVGGLSEEPARRRG